MKYCGLYNFSTRVHLKVHIYIEETNNSFSNSRIQALSLNDTTKFLNA